MTMIHLPDPSGSMQNPKNPPVRMLWACPYCGSPDLLVYYSERRVALVDQTLQDALTPYYPESDLVDVDSNDQSVHCESCHAVGITAVQQRGDGKEDMAQYPLRVRASILLEVRRTAKRQRRSMNAVLNEALSTYLFHMRGASEQEKEG